MKYNINFLPEIEQDILSSYTWYKKQSYGLGEEFLRTFYASAKEILRNPCLYPKISSQIRRCLIRRFPYAIYYSINKYEILAIGFFHCSRSPNFITTQLEKRSTQENS